MLAQPTDLRPEHATFRLRFLRSVAPLLVAVQLPMLGACGRHASAESSPREETATSTLKTQPTSDEAVRQLQEGDAELRRGYGVVDMRYDPCVTAQGDQTLLGEACASGFLIYGPYVNVPGDAEITVTFDVQATQRVEVYADIVSRMAKQAIAGLSPQVIEAGVTQRLGYRVHIFKAEQFVESRIGLRSPTPARFSVSNYTMTVH